jgi:SIR2-like domain
MQVAGGVLTREQEEPIDRFLGRLAARGVKVHEQVKEILSNPNSSPNALHFDLLRLFEPAARTRLVTTNFDPHFTNAARKILSSKSTLELYSAPALPLGGDLYGIVHLHGSVAMPPDRLVLTDADFGRAYLTEGWATKFLQTLFARYVVPFVGYSHRDPVMSYLARGLPPGSVGPSRFALTAEGDEDRWRFLGIQPITYRLSDGENSHSALGASVAAWAGLATIGALDQEQKIKTIVEGPFPLRPEDSDYIENALRNITTTRFFVRYARNLNWLRWVESKGFLAPLFRSNLPVGDIAAALGAWLAENFVSREPGNTRALIEREGQRLNPILWNAIAFHLFRWMKTPERDPNILRQWISLLTNVRPCPGNSRLLDYMLNQMNFPDDKAAAVLLFDYLIAPTSLLKKDFWTSCERDGETEDAKIAVQTEGDDYFLMNSWRRFFRPNLESFADELAWVLTGTCNALTRSFVAQAKQMRNRIP